jgi:hypothetical protein
MKHGELKQNSESTAERLVGHVFAGREREADPAIARLRFERLLAQQTRRSRVRPLIKAAALFAALLVLGGWATTLPVASWDDGQQITIAMPADFSPGSYPYWVAVFASRVDKFGLGDAHSLVVDYKVGGEGEYYLQLGILGTDYTKANEWVRAVMADVPDLARQPYSITQPQVPYRCTVRDMLAYRVFGRDEALEHDVVRAWLAGGQELPRHIFLISRSADYAKRVSKLDY